MRIRHFTLALFLFVVLVISAKAEMMDYVSDLISTSAPSVAATHRIQFTVVNAIPPSGSITITPQAGAFTIPSDFDYTDVEVAVWDGVSYVDRVLAASPSAIADGISVTTGTSGSITITLSSAVGILAGDKLQVRLGTNTTFGASGTASIVNPGIQDSYRIFIESKNDTDNRLDFVSAMIAVVNPVTIFIPLENTPPAPSNGLPSGQLAAGNSTIEITFETDRTATCRYAMSSGVPYESMTESFTSVGGTFFYIVVSGHEDATSYNYYVKCRGVQGALSNDYPISFSLAETPISDTSELITGHRSGTGTFSHGSATLYLSTVTLLGYTAPVSTVVVLKDGKQIFTTQSSGDGSFRAVIPNLERGTYNFSLYSLDSKQRKSASYTSTLAVSAATNNVLTGITLPPTVVLDKDSVAIGEDVFIRGETVPGAKVEISLTPQSGTSVDTKQYIASSTGVRGAGSGAWELKINGRTLQAGTYRIGARTTLLTTQSDSSTRIFLGVGQSPSPNLSNKTDINGDNKVNLVDFSILLSFWGTSNASADINADGIVNLADFSILLFNWTG